MKDYYTIKEFAKLINVHINTIRTAIKEGRINAFKVGNGLRSCYRIPHSELEKLVILTANQNYKRTEINRLTMEDIYGKDVS